MTGVAEEEMTKEMEPEKEEVPVQETSPEEPKTEEADAPQETVSEEETLRAELEKSKAQAEEYLNLVQHVQADFDNYRRRNEKIRTDAYAEGQRNVVGSMLTVLDNLERALSSAQEDSPLKSGVELTLKSMRDINQKLGVTEINRVGEAFDPKLENAVMRGEKEEGEPGTVCAVLQKGYSMNGTVIRHAMVKVVADD